jgi:PilZ domain-containing protein
MSGDKNMRRHRRIPYFGPIRICWEERGQPRFAMAKCVDISDSGLCIESPVPVPAGVTLQLGAERIKLAGAAAVKHVVRNGSKYLLGVQLTQLVLNKIMAELEGRSPVTVLIENLNKIDQKV